MRPIAFAFLSLASLFVASITSAESVIWNTSQNVQICGDTGQECSTRLRNMNITIQYHVQVTDAETGEIYSSGVSVPVGTRLNFRYIPHTYEDVSWFGSGGTYDSPYGEWRAGAVANGVECLPKDQTENVIPAFANGQGVTSYGTVHFPLVVHPPVKTISGLAGLSCGAPGADGSVGCTASMPGEFSAQFKFAETYGKYYARYFSTTPWNSYGSCLGNTHPAYQFNGPFVGQFSNFSLASAYMGGWYDRATGGQFRGTKTPYTVDVPVQSIPFSLTVVTPTGNPPDKPSLSSASCTVGTPLTISMVSTDPDDDLLRYAVDWNADGTLDQWLPPSGYVPSGVAQTASRTYVVAGSKALKVLARDKNGLASGWATLTFRCMGSATVGLSDTNTGDVGNNVASLLPDIDLRVIPSLIKSGNTTKVNWNAANVRNCTVSAPNGDSWTALLSPLGGQTSRPITGETTYTLNCINAGGATFSKQAKVRIIPTFEEI